MKADPSSTILLVDDDETARVTFAGILIREGYTVYSVASGEQALAFLQQGPVDLILLELRLDGLDVLRVIANKYPNTPVILFTAYGSLESAVEALRLRAFDYLVKPLPPQQVLESVQRALVERASLLQRQAQLDEMEDSLRRLMERGPVYPTRVRASSEKGRLVYLGSGVMVDFDRRELWSGSGSAESKRVRLTPAESRLLKVLLERGGEVLSHKELVVMAQGYEVMDWEAPEVIRPLVSRLRQKLAHFPGGEHWILNVRGKGYLFERRGAEHRSAKGA
jgi:DNA-binding response OmpR family regulator